MLLPVKNFKFIWIHVLIWISFFIYEQVVFFITENTRYDFRFIIPTYLLNVILFYVNSNILLPKLSTQQYWMRTYTPAAFGLLALYGFLRCEINLHVLPNLTPTVTTPAYSYISFWILAVYRGTFFQFASTGYWFACSALEAEKQKRMHEKQLYIAEKKLLQLDLELLRKQINPHFLFNSLNLIYAQVRPHSESAAKSILLLSDTLRYALNENGDDKVMLNMELENIKNYIAINQLRFNDKVRVDFKIVGSSNLLMIMPLILLTFVENCFKHGELTDQFNPLKIHIKIVMNHLTFSTFNKKRHSLKEECSGIGLLNTRRRLDMMYANRYDLVINDELDYYSCILNISL